MRVLILILLFSKVLWAQSHQSITKVLELDSKYHELNFLDQYSNLNFSQIWTQTKNDNIYGIIGEDHQRIRIKLLTVNKSLEKPEEYWVRGKSMVKGVICSFEGTIRISKILISKNLHYGLDDEYKSAGIQSQGIIIAEYEFLEDSAQFHSGSFKGTLYSKWYLNSAEQVIYDDIELFSDYYINNAFIGTWQSHLTEDKKICHWGDYRVPEANNDFDIGAAEFSPNEIYYDKGWQAFKKPQQEENSPQKKAELKEWW